MRIEKKLSKIKTSMCPQVYLILVCDTRQQPGVTQNPLTPTSRTTEIARANKARHEHPRLYDSIQGEASVSIYILALALSRVLLARVYSRHQTHFRSETPCPDETGVGQRMVWCGRGELKILR